jgi:hypothetical protein
MLPASAAVEWITARVYSYVFKFFGFRQNFSLRVCNYFQLNVATSVLGKTALGEGLLVIARVLHWRINRLFAKWNIILVPDAEQFGLKHVPRDCIKHYIVYRYLVCVRLCLLCEDQGCGVCTQKLRLRLHKNSMCINNGKPVRRFIATTWIIRLLFWLITYI